MERVTLLYDRDCPNAGTARGNLLRAFAEAGTPARWDEVDLGADDTPAGWRGYGSPTVLVDGRDADGTCPDADAGRTCRTYLDGVARHGAPPVGLLVAALRAMPPSAASAPSPPPPTRAAQRSARQLLVAAPGVAMALLPKVACPACWPAYAGLLSSMGLGFLMETRYLLPLTGLFVGLTLATLAWRAERRRGFGPVLLGALAAAVLLIGKFVYDLDAATWAGVSALVGASLWNAWPRKAALAPTGSCPSCVPDNP